MKIYLLSAALIMVLCSCNISKNDKSKTTGLSIPLSIPNGSWQSDISPQSGMYFKNMLSDSIFVFDIRKDDNVAKMVSCVAQGIINQEVASVYLCSEEHHFDQINDTKCNFKIESKYNNEKYGGLGSLILKYQDRFNKLVVWDESKEWTWCLAQMIAAQQGGIPVTLEIKDFMVNDLGWKKEIYDIRNLWPDKQQAYQWALDNLSGNCNKTLCFSAGLRGDYTSNPWRIYDYAAASKGFVFWLDTKKPEEATILDAICTRMDYQPGSSAMGYGCGSDGDGLNSIINKHNVGFMVSDYYANGSFWCSFPGKSFRQRRGQAVRAKAGKVYVSFIWSDGDNIQFDANQLYNMFKKSKRRGEVPVGVTMAASLQQLNPFLLEFYYKNRTPNDELLAGPSGFQFIYGDVYNTDGYDKWLVMNQKWMKSAGFHTACLWNTSSQVRFDKYMSTCGLQGVFDGNDKANNKYFEGVVAVNQGTHCWKEGDVYNDLVKVKSNSLKPLFRNVYLIAASYGGTEGYERLIRELQRLEKKCPDTYVYLLPMDLSATLKKYILLQ